MTPVICRLARADEAPLVYATWLASYRSYNQRARKRWHQAYFEEQHALIERILAHPATSVHVVETTDGGPRPVLGWLCSSSALPNYSIIHYAYVKGPYRQMGFLDRLMRYAGVASPLVVTAETRPGGRVVDAMRRRGWAVELLDPRDVLL